MTRLSEIRAREQAATPGEWSVVVQPQHAFVGVLESKFVRMGLTKDTYHQAKFDAWFIAHARADIPYLLSLIDEIAARPEDVRGILEREGIDVPPSQTP